VSAVPQPPFRLRHQAILGKGRVAVSLNASSLILADLNGLRGTKGNSQTIGHLGDAQTACPRALSASLSAMKATCGDEEGACCDCRSDPHSFGRT
jgi:hypothetical protein